MAPSEDPRDWRAGLKDTGLETSSGGKPARLAKATRTAHLTFVIDCARGTKLSLAAPPMSPAAPSPQGAPVPLPVKTYIVFWGEKQPQPTREAPRGAGRLSQAGDTPPGLETPAPLGASPPCPQQAPEAQGSPLKAGPARSLSPWGTVKGSLKALSSCVCGVAD